MKVQVAQIDLMHPIPRIQMRDGYSHMRVIIKLASQPLAQFDLRPRGGMIQPRAFIRRVAKWYALDVMRALSTAALRNGKGRSTEYVRKLSHELDPLHPLEERWPIWVQFVQTQVLSTEGLRAPFRDWILADEARRGEAEPGREWPRVTVVVCTADRAAHIGDCIESLQQQDYPNYEILIADNSRDTHPTREAVLRAGVKYLRVVPRGLSYARNAAVDASRTTWIAFTDDDCRPHRNWLRELVRPTLGRPSCMGVTGLVIPAQLESDAELTFESYGGLGRGFKSKCFNHAWLRYGRLQVPRTWEIGAGANMLLRRSAVRAMGGFDVDLGAGRPAGCSEDTDVYYQILRHGGTIEYTPRAIVDHYHRCNADSLRRQIHNYAKGHAAYHVRCFVRYRDIRSLLWLMFYLPKSLRRRMRSSWRGWSPYPLMLVVFEMHGTFIGPWLYARAKVGRLAKAGLQRLVAVASTLQNRVARVGVR